MTQSPAVIVHGLAMARVAVAPSRPVTLLSADGAGVYAGVGWWQALVRAVRSECAGVEIHNILDCGASPGRALEALRAGQLHLVLRAERRVWDDIAWRVARQGGVLLAEPPPALDLGKPGAPRQVSAWLGLAQAGDIGPAVL
jgi:hypothetical protein